MKFFNRVRQLTSTTGTGDTIALGSAFSNAFNTLAQAGAVLNDETAVWVEQGTDFAVYRVKVNASAASIDILSVEQSKIGGTAGTSRINLDGTAVVRFAESAADLNGFLRTDIPQTIADGGAQARANIGAVLRGHLFGLTLSNNTTDAANDMDVAAGECASEQSTPILMTFAGVTGAQLDVAYGTGSGARFDSSISDGTWHCFVASNGTLSTFGMSKSLNPTGTANYPSGYTHYRRIGSIIRASSIRAFTQDGDNFLLTTPVLDVTATNPGTGATTHTLSVPSGHKFEALVTAVALNTGTGVNFAGRLYSPETADTAPANAAASLVQLAQVSNQAGSVIRDSATLSVRTNTSSQIRSRFAASDANCILYIQTEGWKDRRGASSGSAAGGRVSLISIGNAGITSTQTAQVSAYPSHFLTLDLGVLYAGDVIDVDAMVLMDKGGTAGESLVLIRSCEAGATQVSGEPPGVMEYIPDGRVLFHNSTVDLEWRGWMPASGRIHQTLRGIGRVVSTGPVILRVLASSSGSVSTSASSQTQMRVWKWN